MLSLIDEVKLTDISELEKLISSTEGLGEYIPTAPTLFDDGETTPTVVAQDDKAPVPNLIGYTVSKLPNSDGKMVCFYLNTVTLTNTSVNQFVLLADCLLTEQDVLFVHLNSTLEIDSSHTIANVIRSCKAKSKIGSIPYSLNTAAFYPAIACNYLISSPYGYAHFDAPNIKISGVHKDSKNAFEYDRYRKLNILTEIAKNGFIPAEALQHILNKQGSYSLNGNVLKSRIDAFNMRQHNNASM